MPPSIPAALVVRRGVQGLSLPQLSVLLENPAEVQKILTHIETERTALLAAKAAAEEIIVEAERREADLVGKEAALGTRVADLDAVHAERMGEVVTAQTQIDKDRRQHEEAVEQHRAKVAAAAQTQRQKTAALDEREAVLDTKEEWLATRKTEIGESQRRVEQQYVDLSQDQRSLDSQRARIGVGIDRMREALGPAKEAGP